MGNLYNEVARLNSHIEELNRGNITNEVLHELFHYYDYLDNIEMFLLGDEYYNSIINSVMLVEEIHSNDLSL